MQWLPLVSSDTVTACTEHDTAPKTQQLVALSMAAICRFNGSKYLTYIWARQPYIVEPFDVQGGHKVYITPN